MWKWAAVLYVCAMCLSGLVFGASPGPTPAAVGIGSGAPVAVATAADGGPTAAQFGLAALAAAAVWRGSKRVLASI